MSKIASALPKSTPNNDENGLRTPKRGRYLKLCLQWHWISSALAVFGMMLFSVTGITLNHAGQIASIPEVTLIERSEEHTSELQSRPHLVCRLLLEKKKK